MVAAKVKMNANGAHTFLEVSCLIIALGESLCTRSDCESAFWYGRTPFIHVLCVSVHSGCVRIITAWVHRVCVVLSMLTPLVVGGAATVNALTGMDVVAACFLLPIGIAVYVVFGGLRATFICDWAHTIILFIVIYLFIGRT